MESLKSMRTSHKTLLYVWVPNATPHTMSLEVQVKITLEKFSSHISSYYIIQSWKILPNTIITLHSHQILLTWHKEKDQNLPHHLASKQRAAFRVHFHYNPSRNVTSATLPSSLGTTWEAFTVLNKSWLLIHIILKNLEVPTAHFWNFLKNGQNPNSFYACKAPIQIRNYLVWIPYEPWDLLPSKDKTCFFWKNQLWTFSN